LRLYIRNRQILRTLVLALAPLLTLTGFTAAAQTVSRQSSPAKRYCQTGGGFCFRYPGSWTMLGDIFGGNGVVVAPPQKQERALWDTITVAQVPTPDDAPAPTLSAVIDRAAAAMRDAGQNFQTLERQNRTVDHLPAETLKARYRENTGREWIEELTFIAGPDDEIYSVALKCAPENLPRLEPALRSMLQTLSIEQPQTDSVAPGNSSPGGASLPPAPAQHP
jgi:hypothetical protein